MWLGSLKGKWLTAGITLNSGIAFLLFGYDQGVFGGLLGNPLFLKTFKYPNATIQGQIVSTYDIGCILGAMATIFIGDKLGRRKMIGLSCLTVIIGGTIQASSYSLGQMIVGRIIAGLGIGSNSGVIPMWQSETCEAKQRGKLIALQLAIVISGISLTNWMNLGFSYVQDNPVSWRGPLAFQAFFAVVAIAMLFFMPESPRWLCMKDRHEEARYVISRLQARDISSPEVSKAFQLIVDTVAHEKSASKVSWREVFSNGEQQTFRRISLGAGCSLMQQMGGINVVVYYMPVVLTQSFGFSDRTALIMSACDFISLVIWGLLMCFFIDRAGRKKMMLFGAFGQGVCFSITAAGLGVGSKASSGVAVAFIFLYHLFFGLSFLSIPFMYPSEVNSNRMRNTGTSIAMMVQWLFVYVVVLITPTGIANIGWRFYIIFGALNLAWVPFIWYFYVETAGLTLEEIDKMFENKYHGGKNMSWKEATCLAREEIAAQRTQISVKVAGGDNKVVIQHEEYTKSGL
ncbi:uncharacterized protein Z519_12187 [Cladophialophora bantiana CBS 173.52]|uniref:Major facilitator superfamily (MFS) profile domain-containing protein n=1 Tax=Cladophialophora bantiana (strain ATCC 10958 / CBS 173.52 / CDC B-1940 / NIH 8579) TaxID=1442370 RepID=A0A0D2HSC3_CLAB1|nr:uncharacterized protein Z519_12187 [Cladophialophora bantiana CBS 173.52]KIW87284.1 hypothetical protein Z519_12187 [Cladophialophora bantiana CBS 173.52]